MLSMVNSKSSTDTHPFTVSVDQMEEPNWNKIVPLFADSSIYQTWAYGAVCWGEKQLSHLLLKRGAEVVAAAQLRLVRLPVVNKGVAYLRWGPLWRLRGQQIESGVLDEMFSALRTEYVGRRGLLLRMLPAVFQDDVWAGAVNSCLKQHELELEPQIRPYHTTRV